MAANKLEGPLLREYVRRRREAVEDACRLSRFLGDACLVRIVGPSGVWETEVRVGRFRAKPKQRRKVK